MITRLVIKGFKTLRDVDIPLSRVSVLVGPNNSGKSNVIRALGFLSDIATERLSGAIEKVGGREAIATRGHMEPISFYVEAAIGDMSYQYKIATSAPNFPAGFESLAGSGPSTFSIATRQDRTFTMPSGTVHLGTDAGDILFALQRANEPEFARRFVHFLSGISIADFSIDRLRAASRATPHVLLSSTGENLAAVLDRLDGELPLVRERIQREVIAAVPGVTRLVTPTVDDEGKKVVGIAEGNNVFRASEVSDGILLFIALSTVTQLSDGSVVCLEEPDRGIHPRRLREVLEQVHRVSEQGSQFVISTHSPVLLNEFRDHPESVLILDRDGDSTRIRQLSALPDIEAQMRDVSLGDLWYSGVLGGVPAK